MTAKADVTLQVRRIATKLLRMSIDNHHPLSTLFYTTTNPLERHRVIYCCFGRPSFEESILVLDSC